MVDKTTDDLHKLLKEQGKDSAEAQEVFKEETHEKLDSLEDHGSTNRLLNVAQGLEAIKGFRERGKILEISEEVKKGTKAEKDHNQGAKRSRKRIEAELKDIKEMLMSQGMPGPMAEAVAINELSSNNQLTIPGIPEGPSRTDLLASSISQMAAATPITFNQEEGQSIAAMKTFADNYSDSGNLGKLADAIEQDKAIPGGGDLVKRVGKLVKALEQGAIGKGDKEDIRSQMSQLTAYADTNKLDIGMGDMMEEFNKNLKNTFAGSIREFFGRDQTGNNKQPFIIPDTGVTDPDVPISNILKQDRSKLALGVGEVQNATRSFERSLDEMLSDKGFKAPSGPQRIRDPQGEQMSQAEILVQQRTGIDNESWGEKQTEKLEEIRQLSEDILGVLIGLDTGGGMGMPIGAGGRRGKGAGRRGGPRTGVRTARITGPGNARIGVTNPGNLKNPVQAKSGRFFEATSPQGQAILNNSGPRNASTMGRITDAVRNPTQTVAQGMGAINEGSRGLKVASGVAKIAGPAFAVADVGMTGYEVYQNQQAVGEVVDERTGEIYTQKSATADNTEAITSTATGLGTAAVGAGYGAAIGTAIMPGVGTLVGGAIGGAVGYVAGSKVGQAIGDLFTESEMEKNLKSAEEKGIYQWNWMQDKVVGPLDKATDAELQSMISQDDVSEGDMRKLQDEFYKRNPVGQDSAGAIETAGATPTGAAVDNMTTMLDDTQAMADQASQQVLISNVSNVSGGGEQEPIIAAISKPGPRELNTSSISRLQDSRFS